MAFPTTGILDSFNRANEGPPAAGWTTIYNGHKVASNTLIGNTVADANVSAWNTSGYGPSIEAYITLTQYDAYPTLYILDSALSVGYSVNAANGSTVRIFRQDSFGNTEVQLGADIATTWASGDSIGIYYDADTSTIRVYRKPNGGSWSELGSRTDSTYTSLSRIAIFTYDTRPVDDFGGGTVANTGVTITPAFASASATAISPTVIGGEVLNVAFVAASTNGSTTAGTTATVNVPASTTAGDLLIAVVVCEITNATITPNQSGWTQLWSTGSGGGTARTHTQAAFARRASASEPANYTFGISSSEWAGVAVTYRNAAFPAIYSSQFNNSSTASCTAPALTTTVANSLCLWVGSNMYGTTWTAPTNYTERLDYRTSTGTSNLSVSVAERLYTATGSTGTAVGTSANADYNAGGHVALSPAIIIIPGVASAGAMAVAPTVETGSGSITITPSPASAVASTRFVLLCGATTNGVLRRNATNGRYLENNDGLIFLAGFHTWYNFFNGGTSDPPPAFTWTAYVTSLIEKNVNHVRAWIPETIRAWPSTNDERFEMLPWTRTGPGNAADGHLKFDLATFNQDFFDRIRSRCIELGNAGIYVTLVLFNGFHIDNTKPGGGAGDPWAYHPFNTTNNINGLDGDTNDDGVGAEIRATTFTAAYNYQKAYIERVIDTVNDLDNILYEISNEDGTYAEAWQKALIDYIHSYEDGKAKQHPVGMTKLYPGGSNSMLTSSNADWISPDEDLTPAAPNDTDRAWIFDTDHAVGDTTEYKWIFFALARGYAGADYMDPWDSTPTGDTTADPVYEKIRNNLGYAIDYASRIDLAAATPQDSLASTGCCLANTTGALVQLIAYQPTSGNFTVNLTSYPGTYAVEWLRPATGATQSGGSIDGGAVRTLTPPWAGEDAVAFVEQIGYTRDLSASIVGATATASIGRTVAHSLTVSVSGVTATATATTTSIHSLVATIAQATATPAIARTVTHSLTATSVAATATSNVERGVTRSILASIAGATATPGIVTTVSHSLTVSAVQGTATPVVMGAVARPLTASTGQASATATVTAAALRILAGTIAQVTATSAVVANASSDRALIVTAAQATSTGAATATANRSLTVMVSGASTTSTALAAAVRPLAISVAQLTATPTLAWGRLVGMQASVAGLSSTGTAARNVVRNLTSTASNVTVTATAVITMVRSFAGSVAQASVTSTAVLGAVRRLSGTVAQNSAANATATAQRALAGNVAQASGTGAIGTQRTANLQAAIGTGTTTSVVTLTVSSAGEYNLTATIAGATTTNAPGTTVVHHLVVAAAQASATAGMQVGVAHAIQASIPQDTTTATVTVGTANQVQFAATIAQATSSAAPVTTIVHQLAASVGQATATAVVAVNSTSGLQVSVGQASGTGEITVTVARAIGVSMASATSTGVQVAQVARHLAATASLATGTGAPSVEIVIALYLLAAQGTTTGVADRTVVRQLAVIITQAVQTANVAALPHVVHGIVGILVEARQPIFLVGARTPSISVG